MFSNKEEFKTHFLTRLEMMCGKSFAESTSGDQFDTLGHMIREYIVRIGLQRMNDIVQLKLNKYIIFRLNFYLGRLLGNNLLNLGITDVIVDGLKDLGILLTEIEKEEPDAGLGNGGLGRLAACFLDSLASLELPGHGCGIRYKYGLFEQQIIDGFQVELPEQWLRNDYVWEVRKPELAVEVPFWGKVEKIWKMGRLAFRHLDAENVMAVPYDIPVPGYRNDTVNSLRLWKAEPSPFSYHKDFLKYKRETEAITETLYPDDTHDEGKILRLKQQYFLVSASLQSILRSFKTNFRFVSFRSVLRFILMIHIQY